MRGLKIYRWDKMRIIFVIMCLILSACASTPKDVFEGKIFIWDWRKDFPVETSQYYDELVAGSLTNETIEIIHIGKKKISSPGCNNSHRTYKINNNAFFMIGGSITQVSCIQIMQGEDGDISETYSIKDKLEQYWNEMCNSGCTITQRTNGITLSDHKTGNTVTLIYKPV